MKNLFLIMLSVLFAGVLIVGCDMFGNDGPENGTLTVSISDAATVNGYDMQVSVSTKDKDEFSGQEDLIAFGRPEIQDGSAEVTVKEYTPDSGPSDITWTGTGGETYYVYIRLIDSNGDPTHFYQQHPYEYSQDEDEVLETTFSEYEEIDP